jgi:acyl transferase domain-containing protein
MFQAGISMFDVSGTNTAVYAGSTTRDYDTIVMKDPEADTTYSSTGLSPAMLSNRISWFYDL